MALYYLHIEINYPLPGFVIAVGIQKSYCP